MSDSAESEDELNTFSTSYVNNKWKFWTESNIKIYFI